MGFFRTLFNVFSGPAFFLNLLDCRFRKAVLHLVLLSLLLSLALTLGHSWIYSSRIRTVCGNLYEQIGSLRFTRAEGVRTLNRPQEKQSYLLTDQLRFDYLFHSAVQFVHDGDRGGIVFQCDAVFLERDVGTETDVQTDRGSADLHFVSRHGCNCVVFLFLGADDFTADGVFSGILSVLSGGVPAGSAGVESAAGTGTG